jgi:hypothetical protein
MQKGKTKELDTLMVHGVTAAATPDGRIALVLHLKDRAIGLEMNQQGVDDMRHQLAVIETFLRQKVGSA